MSFGQVTLAKSVSLAVFMFGKVSVILLVKNFGKFCSGWLVKSISISKVVFSKCNSHWSISRLANCVFWVVAKDSVVCKNLVKLAVLSFCSNRVLRSVRLPNTACTRLVGVAAFSSRFLGLKLVPSKWRGLVPPTSG